MTQENYKTHYQVNNYNDFNFYNSSEYLQNPKNYKTEYKFINKPQKNDVCDVKVGNNTITKSDLNFVDDMQDAIWNSLQDDKKSDSYDYDLALALQLEELNISPELVTGLQNIGYDVETVVELGASGFDLTTIDF